MSNHVINEYISGAISGAVGLFVGHPFDTTKVQLQVRQASSPYKSIWDAIKTINSQGFARGFYRGMAFPVASYGVINSVFFGVYGQTLTAMSQGGRSLSYLDMYIAGCVGGAVQSVVVCPVEVVKCTLQAQIRHTSGSTIKTEVNSQYFKGPIQCMKYIYKTAGMKGLYRGYFTQFTRDVPASGVYFLVYEFLYNMTMKYNLSDSKGMVASFFSGGMAGVISWFVIIPFDVIKSQVQADLTGKMAQNSIWTNLRNVMSRSGVKGLYAGGSMVCLRAFPVNAVTFLAHLECMKLLSFLSGAKRDRYGNIIE